jgi:hypothetical protein
VKTLTVIGVSASGGFGNFLADSLADEYEVTRHGRSEPEWKTDSDVVVLNMFDRERPLMQVVHFDRLFKEMKNTNRTLVAIGSTIHYFNKNQSGYANGKCALHKLFYGLALRTGEYECKMVLIEPGSLDNRHGQPHIHAHMKQSELVDAIRATLALKQKFIHLAIQGGHHPQETA